MVLPKTPPAFPGPPREREFFIDNLLVRIHFIIVMVGWTGLAPWKFEFPFPGSLTSTFLWAANIEEFIHLCWPQKKHGQKLAKTSTRVASMLVAKENTVDRPTTPRRPLRLHAYFSLSWAIIIINFLFITLTCNVIPGVVR